MFLLNDGFDINPQYGIRLREPNKQWLRKWSGEKQHIGEKANMLWNYKI